MPRRVSVVVDDDPSIRMFVKTVLQREGFQTLEADGGNPAIEIVRAWKGAIDLIVTDIQMWNGDGLTFAAEAREFLPSVPIILISGRVQPSAGFEFVEKPFTLEGLAKVVRRVVKDKAA